MRALIQRVSAGSVEIKDNNSFAEIGRGMVILLGIKDTDDKNDVIFTADKCCGLRIFEDKNEKMNLSVRDVDGEVLIISQFTLYGETRKGNRPSFTNAARPEYAIPLYEKFIERVSDNIGENKVKTGEFGTMMNVKILNEGPVTVIVESKEK